MKYASFSIAGRATWGAVESDTVIDLAGAVGAATLRLALQRFDFQSATEKARAHAPRYSLKSVVLAPVIPDPEKILCVGLNYETHRKETGRSEVLHPTIFTRFADCQVADGAPVICPRVSRDLDYEAELAVIIGKSGRHIKRDDAMKHVAGYACYNDVSVRDWQRHTHQFTPGSGHGWSHPDEVGPLPDLRILARLNGQVVQDAQLGDMIFDIPTIIEYCSGFTQLNPGDVIATGTPGGVGAKRTPPLWMKPGDTIEIEIDRVGLLRNPVIAEG
jgi:2-keto-4-pentenoate hydratase/2-oxohepta-3-ene-1,7-dioic acid hydratase in catechol pathway